MEATGSKIRWNSKRKVNRTHRRQLELSEGPVSNRHLERPHQVQVPDARAERQGAVARDDVDPVGPSDLLHRRLPVPGAAPLHGVVGDPRHAHRVARPGAELVALRGADERAFGVERPDPDLGVGVPVVLIRERVDHLLEEGGIRDRGRLALLREGGGVEGGVGGGGEEGERGGAGGRGEQREQEDEEEGRGPRGHVGGRIQKLREGWIGVWWEVGLESSRGFPSTKGSLRGGGRR